MDTKYVYSAKKNAFYATSMKEIYEDAGTWPGDAIDVSDAVYEEFAINTQPSGKFRIATKDGSPAWEDIPEPGIKELQQQARNKKHELIEAASITISPLQDAVDLNIATDDEVSQLNAWKMYRILINRIDTSNAPDIEWPVAPDN